MKFHPLGGGESVSFETTLQQGIAPDGSLYFPDVIPPLDADSVLHPDLTRQEIDRLVMEPWLSDELSFAEITGIIATASTFDTPVVKVGNKQVLELWHGPTMAFKDVAARYLASLMGHFNSKNERSSTVLVATSGDTGGAIAHGFADVAEVEVVVLYPKGKVSAAQQGQLRRTAKNVHTLEVDGVFDNCQAMVTLAMQDPALRDLNLTSANSISTGRLIPQITYYARALAQLDPEERHRFVVPTGNLGNMTAGIMARRMGLPIDSFLASNNSNDALTRYIDSGTYAPAETIATKSNAMDVGKPNNFPRFLQLFGGDVTAAREQVQAVAVDDDETILTIKQVHDEYGYILDPHTAVAWAASGRVQSMRPDTTDVLVSTAAPEKFAEEIQAATGIEIDNSQILRELERLPEEYTSISNQYEELKAYLTQMTK